MIAWELGGNFGHIGRLLPFATELLSRGSKVTFAILGQGAAVYWLREQGWTCVAIPAAPVGHRTSSPAACHADWFLREGFEDTHGTVRRIGQWAQLMDALEPDNVLLDFAPFATYASHFLRLSYVVLSTGFCTPPYVGKPACFRPWDHASQKHAQMAHEKLLTCFADLATHLGANAATDLGELFSVDHVRLCTFTELDHFPQRTMSGVAYEGATWSDLQLQSSTTWRQSSGKKILCYLNGPESDYAELLQYLQTQTHQVIAVLPKLARDRVACYASDVVHIEISPINLQGLLVDCDLLVCHGGLGLVARSLCAATPVFLLPQYAEQALLARRVVTQKLGAATFQKANVVMLQKKLNQLLENSEINSQLKKFTQKYQMHSVKATTHRVLSTVAK